MFNSLSQRLNQSLSQLTGRGRLTEKNIKNSLKEVRMALLEADVALPIVKQLIKDISQDALGKKVAESLNPGQTFIKIVSQHLTKLLGDEETTLKLNAKRPIVILLAGLQGSGKTTTAGKLAKWLMEREKQNVMLTSCDIYRPAAIEQLATLAKQINANLHPSTANDKPIAIVKAAREAAEATLMDVLIVDTAGRTHIDQTMMDEVKAISEACQPTETLFVVDSMTGQDAVNTAKSFHDALPLTGVVLTKIDGDARGGAALSIKSVTEKPIKFLGTGEQLDGLEAFHAERIAQRILGMGDVLSLIENIEQQTDQKKAQQIAKKVQRGKGLNLEDFLSQLKQMKKMGGLASLMSKVPGMGANPQVLQQAMNEKVMVQMQAAIESMTLEERRNPDIIRASRKQRIAKGSGTDVPGVNRLLKQFKQMQKMMKRMKGNNMQRMMSQMQGQMPPGGFPPGSMGDG